MANSTEIAVGYISIIPETSKIAPSITKALKGVNPTKAASSIGTKLIGGISKTFIGSAVAVGATAGTVLASSLSKGFTRLTNIDQAEAKLRGLGNSAEDVAQIMDNANAAVEGTAFSLDAAATTAASAVAAGIEPGQELERVLKIVGDTAAIAGTDLADIGTIFNSVAARGKLQGDDMMQFMERGIPVLQLLADQTGKTAAEVSEMVSAGEIDFQTFATAMESGVGGAALEMGNTFTGAVSNMESAMGRVGETLLTPFFEASPKVIGLATTMLNGINDALKPVMANFSTTLTPAVEDFIARVPAMWEAVTTNPEVTQRFQEFTDLLGTLKDVALQVGPPLMDLAGSVAEVAGKISVASWDAMIDTLNALAPLVSNVLVPMLETTAQIAGENPGAVEALVGAFLGFKAVESAITPVKNLTSTLKNAGEAVSFASKAFKTGDGLAGGLVEIMGGVDSANPAIKGMATTVGGATATMGKASMGFTKVTGETSKFAGVIKKLSPVLKPIGTILKPLIGLFNPWVAGITAVVGALTWFFTETETGKKVWNWLVEAFKTGIAWIGEKLTPVWEGIKNAWGVAMAGIQALWTNILKPVFDGIWQAIQIVGAIIFTVFATPLILAWNLISAAISFVWENIIKPVWEGLKTGLQAVGDFFVWWWNTITKPAWEAFGTGIQWVWDNVVKPVWDVLKGALQAVGDFFAWVWDSIIKPAWNALGTGIQWVWENIIKPAWDGLTIALQAVGDFFSWIWNSIIKPAWDALGTGIQWVVDNIVSPAFEAIKTGLQKVSDFFDTITNGIKNVWDGLRSALAKPINFLIDTVYNNGIRVAWNKVAEFLPDVPEAPTLATIPEHANGGRISGPGTGTSDDVLMWGSNGEHMLTAKEVTAAGGHGAIYAMRDAIAHHRGFTFDGKHLQILPEYLHNSTGDLLGAAPELFPKYAEGGEIRPMWETQLERAHEWAKSRSGRPYVLGGSADGDDGTDCSGFMSGIADVIQGGNGHRQWATMAFNGGGNTQAASGPQGFVAGLKANTFSIGVTNGGAAGGHTAGTLGAVGSYRATNVESGGSPSKVKYGTGAAGADDPYFLTHYHLPIGPDGAFVSGGSSSGPSPDQMRSSLRDRVKEVFDKIASPIEGMFSSAVGDPPPQWFALPPAYLKQSRDNLVDTLFDKVANVGDLLASAYDKAKNLGSIVIPGLFRDTGGWLPQGLSLVRNETGRPEAVLNWEQLQTIRDLIRDTDWGAAQQAATQTAATSFAGEFSVDDSQAMDPYAVGVAIGQQLMTTATTDVLGLLGMGELVDIASSLTSTWDEAWKAQNTPADTPADAAAASGTIQAGDITVEGVPDATQVASQVGGQVIALDAMPDATTSAATYEVGIVKAAQARSLPQAGAVIGMATALVESGDPLKMWANNAVPESLNYPHDAVGSDNDSIGLFQQRNNGAWGTVADRMDPERSAGMFFDEMLRKFPNWASMDPGAVAQGVQVSAFPDRYATTMARGLELVKSTGLYDLGGVLPHRGLAVNLSGSPEAVINAQQWEAIRVLGAALTAPQDSGADLGRALVQDIPVAVAQAAQDVFQQVSAGASESRQATVVQLDLHGDGYTADQVETMVKELQDRVDGLRVEVRRNAQASVLSGVSMMV